MYIHVPTYVYKYYMNITIYINILDYYYCVVFKVNILCDISIILHHNIYYTILYYSGSLTSNYIIIYSTICTPNYNI